MAAFRYAPCSGPTPTGVVSRNDETGDIAEVELQRVDRVFEMRAPIAEIAAKRNGDAHGEFSDLVKMRLTP